MIKKKKKKLLCDDYEMRYRVWQKENFISSPFSWKYVEILWSIRLIGVYSGYKELGAVWHVWHKGTQRELSVFNVQILNENVGLVTYHCKGH